MLLSKVKVLMFQFLCKMLVKIFFFLNIVLFFFYSVFRFSFLITKYCSIIPAIIKYCFFKPKLLLKTFVFSIGSAFSILLFCILFIQYFISNYVSTMAQLNVKLLALVFFVIFFSLTKIVWFKANEI